MMGKATGWLRSLFSGGRKKTSPDGKDKKGWSFMKSLRDKEGGDQMLVTGNRKKGQADPLCCSMSCNACGSGVAGRAVVVGDEEQSKRAIAVAAATAAVAEAAVAAAQAAAAVVRLTSKGAVYGGASGRRRDEWAAIQIQSAFRGYLARRALKALKGLVKIQALVRGHIVRKQAAETLRSMHALVRAQARVREGRYLDQPSSRGSMRHSLGSVPSGKDNVRSSSAKVKNASRVKDRSTVDKKVQKSSSWNWLDHWKEEQYRDGRESMSRTSKTDEDKDEKILEIDAGRPHTKPRWRNTHYSVCSTMASDTNSHSFTTMPDSPSKDSTVVQRSVPSPSSVDMQPPLGSLMFPLEGVEYFESPQFYSASSRSRRGPFTPSKSECTRSFFAGYSGYPNYMANTKSSRAKVRSQSAPRQRPEYEMSSFLGQVQGRGASSGSSSQRSMQLKFTGKAYPGSGRLDRLGMPTRM